MLLQFLEFYVRSFAVIIPALAITVFAINGKMAGLGFARMQWLIIPMILFFGFWYAIAAAASEVGLLAPPLTITSPPYVLMFMFGGAGLFWAFVRFNALSRTILQETGQIFLIGMQIPRVMGGVFLIGWAAGAIPWQFALPAGVGDIWAGLAAIQATRALRRDSANANQLVMRANIIGLLDFVVAVSTGVLSSEGFARLFAHGQPNIITDYPLSMFPGFFVPIFIGFHLFSLEKLRQSPPLAHAD